MSSAPTADPAFAYIDSSAFTKTLVDEPESSALSEFLAGAKPNLVSSALLRVETSRAVAIAITQIAAVAEVDAALEEITLVAVSDAILRRASTVEPKLLRTLDALHLATALELGVGKMIVYDSKLGDAARAHGLKVTAPGA